MAKGPDPLIGPHMTVREAVLAYPGIEAVFERHGLAGCGGPEGPIEPIAFFARVHEVDPAALLRALNEFAARRAGAVSLPLVDERPKQPFETYRLAIFTSLALALAGGLPLAVLVALGGGRDIGLGVRWAPLVQAHGHLQLVGFVGVFIVGLAYHVLPRFKNTELRLPGFAIASIGLLAGGVVLRTATQPWADAGLVGALFVASAVIELAGALAFFAVVVSTLSSTPRKNYDRFLLAAVAWFAAASVMNLVVAAEVVSDGVTTAASSRGTPLLEMYIFGFVTIFILGVSIRVLPHFVSLRPPRVRFLTPALLLFNTALLARVGSGWLAAYAGWSNPEWLQTAAVYGMGAAVLLFVFALNLHRAAVRADDGAPAGGHERLIRVAYVWLVVAFAIEAWYASKGLAGDFRPDFLENGAARHALAVGFFTQMIFGVGARALPAFAGRSLYSPRLLRLTWVLINMAVIMRVGHAVIPASSTTFRFDSIAVSGAIAFLAVSLFTYNIFRTVAPLRRRRAPSRRKEDSMPPGAKPEPSGAIQPENVVADVLDRVPGSLDLLLSYGFKPLADPEMRAKLTPNITLGMACEMHGIDVQALIADLERLEAGDGQGADVTPPAQRILNALRDCRDPEIPVNIVDLGLVYGVEADGESATVRMALTSPHCPLAGQILDDVRERIRALGFTDVDVQLVKEPPWEPSRMSPAARQALGW